MSVVSWLFRSRETGRITIAQWPNLSMGLFIAATIVLKLFDPAGSVRTMVVVVRTAALLWWAVDELFRGVNPWRRGLGAVVLASTLFGLAT